MKAFIADFIPKIQRFSEKLDNLTLLANQHWVLVDEITKQKHVYIFRSNNELLISTDGKVQKAKWEYLGHRSILIDKQDESYLFKHGFFDDSILALKRDNSNDFTLFVNENKYDEEINSAQKVIEFLAIKYLTENDRKLVEEQTGIKIQPPPMQVAADINDEQVEWDPLGIFIAVVIVVTGIIMIATIA